MDKSLNNSRKTTEIFSVVFSYYRTLYKVIVFSENIGKLQALSRSKYTCLEVRNAFKEFFALGINQV